MYFRPFVGVSYTPFTSGDGAHRVPTTSQVFFVVRGAPKWIQTNRGSVEATSNYFFGGTPLNN